MDMDLFQPDDIPSTQEGERTIICSCPKCSAKIERELAEVVADSSPNTCPACKARYVLTRESFASRATRKTGEIHCAECGGALGHSQFCPSCKALYPDYYAPELPDAAKKRARQSRDLFSGLKSFSFEWRSSATSTFDYKPVLLDSEPWQEPVATKRRSFTALISAVIILAVIAGGVGLYYNIQAKKRYATAYMTTLYAIKMGADLSLQMCGKISSEWTSKGMSAAPRATVDEENQLNKLKEKTDTYLQKLGSPPSAFVESNQRLKNLHAQFLKVHAAALNPSGSPAAYTETFQKADSEFKSTAADLKKSLPKELKAELEITKTKYRGMGDF